MANNPILDELRATRERLLAESGGTVSGLLDRLRADQAASNRTVYKPALDGKGSQENDAAKHSKVENLSSPSGDR